MLSNTHIPKDCQQVSTGAVCQNKGASQFHNSWTTNASKNAIPIITNKAIKQQPKLNSSFITYLFKYYVLPQGLEP